MMSSAPVDEERKKADLSAKYATLFENYAMSYSKEVGMTPKMATIIARQKALTDVVFNLSYIRRALKEEKTGDSRNMKWLLKNAPRLDDKYAYTEIIDLVKKIDIELSIVEIKRRGEDVRSPNHRMLDGLITHINEGILLDLRSQAKREKDAKAQDWVEKRLTELYWRRHNVDS